MGDPRQHHILNASANLLGICFVVVFLTLIAAILGFIAAVGGLGRWYGAIGVVLAFFANPVILIVLVVMVAPELLTDMSS